MSVNLNNCSPGCRLLSSQGEVLIYVDKSGPEQFPHRVCYPDGGQGSRTDDGFVFANPEKRLPEDHDIVEILGE